MRRTLASVLPLLFLAGCTAGRPAAPAGPAATQPASPTPSPTPSLRNVALGQPWDIPGWRITVTGQKCGATSDLITGGKDAHVVETDRVCIVGLTGTNTGTGPAKFEMGSSFEPGAISDASGFDGQGRRFGATSWAQGETNPGVTQKQELLFGVADGVTLSRVVINDVAIPL